MTAAPQSFQQTTDGLRQDEADDYAYRFQYADKSAFQIYADGSAFIISPDGRRERKEGVIINRIPMLIGLAAKPRQDRIHELETALATEKEESASYHRFWIDERAKVAALSEGAA